MSSIDSTKFPEMYSLVDLLNDKKEGMYYSFQLLKTVPPNYKKDFFTVEKILGQKFIKGQLHYLLKYQFYGPKFNQVVSMSDIF